MTPVGFWEFSASCIEEHQVRVNSYGSEVSQISKSKFEGVTSIFFGNIFSVGRRYASSSFAETGVLPKGVSVFNFLGGTDRFHLNGRVYNQGAIAVRSSDFLLVTPDAYTYHSIVVSESGILRVFSEIDNEDYLNVKSKLGAYSISDERLVNFVISKINFLLSFYCNEKNLSIDYLSLKDIECDLFRIILSVGESKLGSSIRINRREKIVGRALEFMTDSDLSKVGLVDVALSAHVSQRTLELSFKACLGSSPKKILVRMRLNSIRRGLLMSDKSISIRSVARKYGVIHMGHFSCCYKSLFGELPSETQRISL